jgi:hypothetical protein
MITYTATNTKTGKFYIGSAKDYCNYMNRKGNHHVGKPYNDFRKELQAYPHSFTWEYSEDESGTRDFEESLLHLYVGSKWCYNKSKNSKGCAGDSETTYRGGKTGMTHSEETRIKMSASASRPEANPPHKKEAQREAMRRTSLNKKPCPQCGMMLGPGNLTKHLKGTRCKGTLYVG